MGFETDDGDDYELTARVTSDGFGSLKESMASSIVEARRFEQWIKQGGRPHDGRYRSWWRARRRWLVDRRR